jgi:hypothetical protein
LKTVVRKYRGFESLTLRHPAAKRDTTKGDEKPALSEVEGKP